MVAANVAALHFTVALQSSGLLHGYNKIRFLSAQSNEITFTQTELHTHTYMYVGIIYIINDRSSLHRFISMHFFFCLLQCSCRCSGKTQEKIHRSSSSDGTAAGSNTGEKGP